MTLRRTPPAERCDFPDWFKIPKRWHSLAGNNQYVYHQRCISCSFSLKCPSSTWAKSDYLFCSLRTHIVTGRCTYWKQMATWKLVHCASKSIRTLSTPRHKSLFIKQLAGNFHSNLIFVHFSHGFFAIQVTWKQQIYLIAVSGVQLQPIRFHVHDILSAKCPHCRGSNGRSRRPARRRLHGRQLWCQQNGLHHSSWWVLHIASKTM